MALNQQQMSVEAGPDCPIPSTPNKEWMMHTEPVMSAAEIKADKPTYGDLEGILGWGPDELAWVRKHMRQPIDQSQQSVRDGVFHDASNQKITGGDAKRSVFNSFFGQLFIPWLMKRQNRPRYMLESFHEGLYQLFRLEMSDARRKHLQLTRSANDNRSTSPDQQSSSSQSPWGNSIGGRNSSSCIVYFQSEVDHSGLDEICSLEELCTGGSNQIRDICVEKLRQFVLENLQIEPGLYSAIILKIPAFGSNSSARNDMEGASDDFAKFKLDGKTGKRIELALKSIKNLTHFRLVVPAPDQSQLRATAHLMPDINGPPQHGDQSSVPPLSSPASQMQGLASETISESVVSGNHWTSMADLMNIQKLNVDDEDSGTPDPKISFVADSSISRKRKPDDSTNELVDKRLRTERPVIQEQAASASETQDPPHRNGNAQEVEAVTGNQPVEEAKLQVPSDEGPGKQGLLDKDSSGSMDLDPTRQLDRTEPEASIDLTADTSTSSKAEINAQSHKNPATKLDAISQESAVAPLAVGLSVQQMKNPYNSNEQEEIYLQHEELCKHMEKFKQQLLEKTYKIKADKTGGGTATNQQVMKDEIDARIRLEYDRIVMQSEDAPVFDIDAFLSKMDDATPEDITEAETNQEKLLINQSNCDSYEHIDLSRHKECMAFFRQADYSSASPVELPIFKRAIYHYQLTGAYFLLQTMTGMNGAVLADVPGSGKTTEMIVVIVTYSWIQHVWQQWQTDLQDLAQRSRHVQSDTNEQTECLVAKNKLYPICCPCERGFPAWLKNALIHKRLPLGSPVVMAPAHTISETVWLREWDVLVRANIKSHGGLVQPQLFVAHGGQPTDKEQSKTNGKSHRQKFTLKHASLFTSVEDTDQGTVEQTARVILTSAASYAGQFRIVVQTHGRHKRKSSYIAQDDSPEAQDEYQIDIRGQPKRVKKYAYRRKHQPWVNGETIEHGLSEKKIKSLIQATPVNRAIPTASLNRAFVQHCLLVIDECHERKRADGQMNRRLYEPLMTNPFRKAIPVGVSGTPWESSPADFHPLIAAMETRNNFCLPGDEGWSSIPDDMKRNRLKTTELGLLRMAKGAEAIVGKRNNSSASTTDRIDNFRRANNLVTQYLQPLMLRRTEATEYNGRPMLAYPEKEVIDVDCPPITDAVRTQLHEALQNNLKKTAKIKGNQLSYNDVDAAMLSQRVLANIPALGKVQEEYGFQSFTKTEFNKALDCFKIHDVENEETDKLSAFLDDMIMSSSKLQRSIKIIEEEIMERESPTSEFDPEGKIPERVKKVLVVAKDPVTAVCMYRALDYHFATKSELRIPDTDNKVRVSVLISEIEMKHRDAALEGFTETKVTGADGNEFRKRGKSRVKYVQHVTYVLVATLRCVYSGLNLQRASRMIFVEPWVGQTQFKQASQRCARLGQLNKVKIYRLISRGVSCDEGVLEKGRWRQLFQEICMQNNIMPRGSGIAIACKKRISKGKWSLPSLAPDLPGNLQDFQLLPSHILQDEIELKALRGAVWLYRNSQHGQITEERERLVDDKNIPVCVYNVQSIYFTAERFCQFQQLEDSAR